MRLLRLLAQEPVEEIPFRDNKILDEWVIPFGAWVDQMVDWIDQNMGLLLDIIRAPFAWMLENLVDNFIAEISWVWVCLIFFIVGSLVRNVKIGAMSALALAGCGLLGTNYWFETARTIGMILVAVILCAIVGIPIGVLCGRFDGVWNAVRPALDAMQVVHAFVYMLPVIFFFSFGVVPGTMVTMIFAIPPLIRLTNLGIRQVPEDVVEASRAYGAPELRVLFDVQLPLARPAIMTGLNQTLLLSISMIGIAAIMGAGGLGLLVFRAVSNLDISLAASAGMALFLVAVVLDRISQPEASDGGNLFHRIRQAWVHRNDPEKLLDTPEAREHARQAIAEIGVPTPMTSAERPFAVGAIVGGLIGIASVFMTWSSDAGLFSGYARRGDENLPGETFGGLDAIGGSFFAFVVLVASTLVIAAAINTLLIPGRGARWFAPDGAMLYSSLSLITALGFLLADPSPLTQSYSHGAGVYAAVAGGVIAVVSSILWIRKAPQAPLRPLKAEVSHGRMTVGTVAIVLLVIQLISGWSFDRRADTVMTPELEARIQQVRDDAAAGIILPNIAAQEIQNLTNSAIQGELIVVDGISDDGSRLGWVVLVIGALGFLILIPAAGFLGIHEHRQWQWSAISSSIGMGLMGLTGAYIATVLRVADFGYTSGAGAFLSFVAGFFLVAANRNVLAEFRRGKVYGDSAVEEAAVVEEAELVDA